MVKVGSDNQKRRAQADWEADETVYPEGLRMYVSEGSREGQFKISDGIQTFLEMGDDAYFQPGSGGGGGGGVEQVNQVSPTAGNVFVRQLIGIGGSQNAELITNGTARLSITPQGAWTVGGVPGSAGAPLLSNGTGVAAAWGTPIFIKITQADHGYAIGTLLRVSGDATTIGALANTALTSDVALIVVTVDDTNTFTASPAGAIVGGMSGLTPGATYYLSTDDEGLMTDTKPTDYGLFVKRVGQAWSATTFFFNPENAIQVDYVTRYYDVPTAADGSYAFDPDDGNHNPFFSSIMSVQAAGVFSAGGERAAVLAQRINDWTTSSLVGYGINAEDASLLNDTTIRIAVTGLAL
jgi:hypothetical protein